jgi:heme-degrading monooxygenase HmoA
MTMITRFRVPDEQAAGFRSQAHEAAEALAAQLGWSGGELVRSVDDPRSWVLTARFEHGGALRRGLGAGPVRYALMSLQRWALDEPSVFEELVPGGVSELGLDAMR